MVVWLCAAQKSLTLARLIINEAFSETGIPIYLEASFLPLFLSQQNTFQCVLAYSGSVTYVLFLYEENVENWWTPAVVGFRNGESL